jgi:hypothetical protein
MHLRNRRAAAPWQLRAPTGDAQISRSRRQTRLERDPGVDATVLRTGSAAISRRREKPVVAAGRSARMIVTVLRGLVAPIAALMIVTTRLVVMPRRLVVAPRLVVTLRRLVVTVRRRLVAMLLLAVLRANRQGNQSGERERCHGKNNRLPKLLTHGIVLKSYGRSEYERSHGPYNARHQQSAVSGDLRRPGVPGRLKQSRHQCGRRIEGNGNVPQAHDYDQYPHGPTRPIFRRGCQP